jgi:hypothetical protein
LVAFDPVRQSVGFTYRDYRDGSKVKELTLSTVEFIRRFSWHILPAGLVRIRHYGILGNNRRHRDIAKARALLEKQSQRNPLANPSPTKVASPTTVATGASGADSPAVPPRRCPYCGSDQVQWVGFITARGGWHISMMAMVIATLAGRFDSS